MGPLLYFSAPLFRKNAALMNGRKEICNLELNHFLRVSRKGRRQKEEQDKNTDNSD
jgi:hypothetical protein